MKIGFHSEQLGIRGTEVALYDYAKHNESLLKNISYIFAPINSNMDGLNKFKNLFNDRIYLYNDLNDLKKYCDNEQITHIYWIKAGYNDGKLLPGLYNMVHAVFQHHDPHGDRYAYVSSWLSEKMSNNECKYVPHMIDLPDNNFNYRSSFNIPNNAIVFSRYGGYDEFDLDFTYPVIEKVAEENSNIYFLFMNTKPFCKQLSNIIHVDPTYDLDEKVAFINTSDCLIHGRKKGETFGLTIAEYLSKNKPVITSTFGEDKAHLDLLRDIGLYYTNQNELYYMLKNFKKYDKDYKYQQLISPYEPERVMKCFKDVFLNE